MSQLNWKSHQIKSLKEYAENGEDLTLADFKLWRNDATRDIKAVGAGFILKMIDTIQLKDEDIPRLVDQSKGDDYTSEEFMKHMVNQAMLCGRAFRDLQPASDLHFKKNYIAVQLDIESFGAQIAKATPKDRKDIFSQEDLMEFPLSPLLEWHALQFRSPFEQGPNSV
mmetsp:Transcript_40929/g.83751  ORF Transcript_40929/g.83751 Transcript_40929/m.83751 type:complete len:168 (-) Transcript_40929:267-770(-)